MQALNANTLRGNWATLLSTWDEHEQLDTARLEAQIDALIAMRVDGIYSHGTAGEFHAQTEAEFDAVAALLSQKCEQAGMPYQIGVSHMSAQISLGRLQRVRHSPGAAGLPGAVQVILPDWVAVSELEAVDFMQRMAEAADGIPLVLYNPPHAKRVWAPEAIGRLAAKVPGLIGLKTAAGDDAWYDAMRRHLPHLSVFVPGHHLACGIQRGARGAYSNVACLNPAAAQRWTDQMQTDLPAALELESRLARFVENHIAPFITRDGYCNGACDRLMALIGGWADVGQTMRWPYRSIPSEQAERLRPILADLVPEFATI